MCGISGVVGAPAGERGHRGTARPARPPRPGRPRPLRRERGTRRPEPPGDHRPRHRRSADHQRGPHASRVVLNGEIYNFRELRDELRARRARVQLGGRHRGDRPPGGGPRAGRARTPARRHVRLRRLGRAPRPARARPRPAGQEAALLLARPAAGSCSAARSRRCSPTPRCRAELDRGAIPAYLTFGYVPTPRTFFEGVRSLPPGHVLTFDAGGEPVHRALLGAAARGLDGVDAALDLSPRGRGARGPRGCSRPRSSGA